MKNNRIFLFLILIISCFGSFGAYAQQIKNKEIKQPVIFSEKPLQFGNDLLPISSLQISKEFPKENYETYYNKIYRFQHLTYDPVRDPKRLVYNTGIYLGSSLIAFGVLWILPESVTGWDKEDIKNGGLFRRWKENVKAGPVWDKDKFFLNWIMHPYIGGIYYMTARGSGFKPWESFTYSFMMSTFFWEYGVEAFAEIPSWQDIIITPTLGSVIGEGFFILKGKVIRNDKKILNSKVLGGVVLFLIDPFNMVLDGFGYKTKNKMNIYSSISPVGFDYASGRSIWGMNVSVRF